MPTVKIEIFEGRGSLVASRNGAVVATINPGDGLVPVTYNSGDSFTFQAYPDTALGYSFNKFCGNSNCSITTTSNPFSGTITQDGYLGVLFTGTPASIKVNVRDGIGGTVNVYINSRFVAWLTMSAIIRCFINDTFEFVAIPSSGYSFQKFCGDSACSITTTSNPFSGTVTAVSGYVYAYFFEDVVTLNMAVSPSGSGTLTTNNQNVGSVTVNYKDTVIWQANPATGWKFDHFDLPDGKSTANPVYWLATISGTTTAVFVRTSTTSYVTLDMAASPSGGGTILTNNQNVGSVTVNYKDTVIWQANPATGWKFDHFDLPDGKSTANPVYWLATVSGTTTAVFAQTSIPPTPSKVTVNMAVLPSGSGTITTNGYNVGSLQFNYKDTVIWQATPAQGWRFDHFDLPDGKSTANPVYWLATVSGNTTAVFVRTSSTPYVTVNMAVSPSGSGTITTNGYSVGSLQFNYKDTVIWQATPAQGWRFDHFDLPDGKSTANPVYWLATVSGTTTAVFVK